MKSRFGSLGAVGLFAACGVLAACGKTENPSGAGGAGNTAGGGDMIGATSGAGGQGAGTSGSGNAGGAGSQISTTSKLDLLLMIDNSVSMAGKQAILKDSVPYLVSRLADPICMANGAPTSGTSASGCAVGSKPQFAPLQDIHIGIVSSSIGAHGGTVCAAGAPTDTLDDKAHLIGSMRPAPGAEANPTLALNFDVTRTAGELGFLAWDPSGKNGGNINDMGTLDTAFQDMLVATGEHGCGYEAQLESWYRFLVDPEPPATVSLVGMSTVRSSKLTLNKDGSAGACAGCDDTLLAQRKAFLRPDSAVVVLMLSDENDCSIRDEGLGWMVGAAVRMPRATAACDKNPNDPCCRSCSATEATPPAGCQALSTDSVCKVIPPDVQFASWDNLHDSLNLRCYNQQQRFGFDLLYKTDRYTSALSQLTIPLESTPGTTAPNPLYEQVNGKRRSPSLVFLEGILGVPWQDIADAPSLTGAGLNYLSAKELAAASRWPALLGSTDGTNPPVPPSDPFMIESTDPRTGTNTFAQPPVAITSADSTDPHANAINGHEQHVPYGDDLQYACTFPLQTPKTCSPGDSSCACSPDKGGDSSAVVAENSPLCQGGPNINTQTQGKAYPGTRELQVLKDFGNNSIVASICPKVTVTLNPLQDANYGYNPAMAALVNRLQNVLQP